MVIIGCQNPTPDIMTHGPGKHSVPTEIIQEHRVPQSPPGANVEEIKSPHTERENSVSKPTRNGNPLNTVRSSTESRSSLCHLTYRNVLLLDTRFSSHPATQAVNVHQNTPLTTSKDCLTLSPSD